jgi:hypothetical protein
MKRLMKTIQWSLIFLALSVNQLLMCIYLKRKSPMTIQNNNYDVDYSQFYLDAKKAFEAIPEAVNNKNYAEAEQCALDAMVEIKLVGTAFNCYEKKTKCYGEIKHNE